jgi:hypothetical protein
VQGWILFEALEIIQGRSGPDVSVRDQIASSRAPHLLIAAGETEKTWGELYDRAAGERAELWSLANATHTAALRQYPREYEQRVVEFFDRYLDERQHCHDRCVTAANAS